MKRSLAPSQLKAKTQTTSPLADENGEITIQRMPLIPFLIIPETLQKQFKVPTGCKITQQSIELRKVKTLGPRKVFREIKPSDIANGFLVTNRLLPAASAEEDADEEAVEDVSCELPPYDPLVLWTSDDGEHKIEVIPSLACRLRPHQREGVAFLFECTMGLRSFDGYGCILADAMGLGKTLMSITLLWTLLNQGMDGTPTVKKAMIVCPTSLIGNWNNELVKWVGDTCPTFPVKDGDAKTIIKHYLMSRGKAILIVSYETQRRYHKLFHANKNSNAPSVCDLLICDEAHKLKNSESGLAKTLNAIPTMRRILLSGTPIQNDLMEFYSMVSFCNPKVLGSSSQFKKQYVNKILLGMERDSTKSERDAALALQTQLSNIVNEFILKRGNILNAQHLPSKYVQHVCCRMTPLQEDLYIALINSKEVQYSINGKHGNVLNHIRYLMLICNHPVLLAGDGVNEKSEVRQEGRGTPKVNYNESAETTSDDPILKQLRQKLSEMNITPAPGGSSKPQISNFMRKPMAKRFNPELSGKFLVLYRLLLTLYHRYDDKIVLISNYTSILGLMQLMCEDNKWNYVRLDGSTNSNKRQQLVDRFNNCPGRGHNGIFVFLLSSKAGGCGLNLIGANRLVLMDPDWNPASDKQAAARIWREGQKKPSYIYHFSSTCSIEEKIIQRQLSKEGLKSAIEGGNGGPVASGGFSTSELKALFCYTNSSSDTHDAIRCSRCPTNKAKRSSTSTLTSDQLALCSTLLSSMKSSLLTDISDDNKLKIDLSSIDKLIDEILSNKYSLLAHISKECRDTMKHIDDEYGEYLSTSAFDAYIAQWMQLIPKLTSAARDAVVDTIDCSVPQIGCPDEDDFNSWSHHSSVNTSEDEALRLAMADDDTVSFIFALRINWDLLQLRMQEDAEAEARKKQRVENDDMDACVSAASDCSDEDEDVEGKDFDESGDDSEMEIEAEKSRHLSATSEKKANQGRDATPMASSSSNRSKTQEDQSPTVARKPRSIVMDSDSDDDLVIVSKPAAKKNKDKNSPGGETTSFKSASGWICDACTYLNSADAGRRCALCDSRRT